MKRWLWLCMLGSAVFVWTSQWHWSQTIDEPQHLWSGIRILQQGDVTRFDNSKMPVSVLNAVGWLGSQSPGQQGSWFWARAPQVSWLLGCMGLVFAWVRRSRSALAALGGAALVGFDPNLMAHAGLVTTDLPCAFGFLLSCYTWSRWLDSRTHRSALWAGAALGAAQLTKFTALFLGPVLGLTTLLWCSLHRTIVPFRQLPMVLAVALLTLNVGYGFSGTLTSTRDIQWKSRPFQTLRTVDLPLPVPKPWIEGVDWVKHDDDIGQGRVYASGVKTHFGRVDHYARTLPRKFPLPLIILSVLGGWTLVRRRRVAATDVSALVAPAFLLVWFSVAFNSQVGSRYVLPVVPFLAILAAHVRGRWIILGAGWTALSAASWWPWGLSYFNETVLDRSQAWRIVADSDLDWGQSDDAAAEWMAQKGEGAYNPDVPAPGPVLVGGTRLTGVLGHPSRMACYREHLIPDATYAGGLYPLDFATRDFQACFPVVEWSGGGSDYPAGDYLVIVRGSGSLELSVGSSRFTEVAVDEALVGAVVLAETPVDFDWRFSGDGAAYVNGTRVAGTPALD